MVEPLVEPPVGQIPPSPQPSFEQLREYVHSLSDLIHALPQNDPRRAKVQALQASGLHAMHTASPVTPSQINDEEVLPDVLKPGEPLNSIAGAGDTAIETAKAMANTLMGPEGPTPTSTVERVPERMQDPSITLTDMADAATSLPSAITGGIKQTAHRIVSGTPRERVQGLTDVGMTLAPFSKVPLSSMAGKVVGSTARRLGEVLPPVLKPSGLDAIANYLAPAEKPLISVGKASEGAAYQMPPAQATIVGPPVSQADVIAQWAKGIAPQPPSGLQAIESLIGKGADVPAPAVRTSVPSLTPEDAAAASWEASGRPRGYQAVVPPEADLQPPIRSKAAPAPPLTPQDALQSLQEASGRPIGFQTVPDMAQAATNVPEASLSPQRPDVSSFGSLIRQAGNTTPEGLDALLKDRAAAGSVSPLVGLETTPPVPLRASPDLPEAPRGKLAAIGKRLDRGTPSPAQDEARRASPANGTPSPIQGNGMGRPEADYAAPPIAPPAILTQAGQAAESAVAAPVEIAARARILVREGFSQSDAHAMAASGTKVLRSALEKELGQKPGSSGSSKWL